MSRHKVEWIDGMREPQCAADPLFPAGKDLDLSFGARRTCTVKLPYPAKRIGAYTIECSTCKLRVGCTTAGRTDDPRSIKLACKQLAN